MSGKFLGARGGLATPEGNAGWSAVRILHQHASRFALPRDGCATRCFPAA
jgi:hypothetical protein